MKTILLSLAVLLTTPAFAGVQFYNSSDTNLGVVNKVKCSTGVTCAVTAGKVALVTTSIFSGAVTITGGLTASGAVTGDGGDAMVGFLYSQVPFAASGSLTAAQCGSTAISSGAVTIALPEASTVLGCQYEFVVGAALTMNINPADGTDKIVLLTDANGDSLAADAIGESIILQAIGANSWAPVGKEQGTWTDSN